MYPGGLLKSRPFVPEAGFGQSNCHPQAGGVKGTRRRHLARFLAMYAASWKQGSYFSWLMPLRSPAAL
jgi:hypothetical protein